MNRIDRDTAACLIDFSAGKPELEQLAAQQLEGAVALHNRLADSRVAYLADEVGMGKTYIALGVAALMRRFNPALRVLYLLPKNNVRDKWVKDYKSFIEYNYVPCDLSVKGLGNQPVAPYQACAGLPELIQSVATSSTRDYFVCTSAFSFALGNTASDLLASLAQFARLLPQHADDISLLRCEIREALSGTELSTLKAKVKSAWASALNNILPRFDLVVVDEAHNLKKGRESSDRNQLLAMLLGAEDQARNRVGRLLLLSATPFDRQLNHLRNQLDLFGFARQVALPPGNDCTSEEALAVLSRLIVRRLNAIDLCGKRHTRNMYRREHRTGEAAEVQMSIEQQLFAALLQKKVSEYLRENCAGRFELGMLASFESYLPGEKNKAIEFDGQDDHARDGSKRDAQDRHVVESLIDDFNQEFKTTPPHPKMDWVAEQAHRLSFVQGKKQLIFVRRVRSVSELKFKLERAYDHWVGDYIRADAAVAFWFDKYNAQVRERNQALKEDVAADGDVEATGENFFTWFYRGKNVELEGATEQLQQLPFNFRNTLGQTSYMFEPNWAALSGMPDSAECQIEWGRWIRGNGKPKPTPQLRFRLAQFAYLKTVLSQGNDLAKAAAERILSVAFSGFKAQVELADLAGLQAELKRRTLWDVMRGLPALEMLSPDWGSETFKLLSGSDELVAERCIRRLLTHIELLAVVCRLDHPFIDLYALRGARKGNDEADADSQLISAFSELLVQQKLLVPGFSSFHILHDVATNLDLLIKLNFAEAYHTPADKLTRYLTGQLNPLSPISGATGENSSNRSPLARKFRMPGYPRVLISTDVFQEGEDLHTFCDSIQHYGISASPIALEQKVGRVDRIASIAHRRMSSAGDQYQQHFIQVSYPHIRESLEFFQVRQAAANLNAFQRSLHKLGDSSVSFQQDIDLRQQLACSNAIEPQITEPLESLFRIGLEDLSGASLCSSLVAEQGKVENRLSHVRGQVERCITHMLNHSSQPQVLRETTEGWGWNGNELAPISIQVRSAKGFAELLLSASSVSERVCAPEGLDAGGRVDWLRGMQADLLVRLQLVGVEPGTDALLIQRNAEVYAGGEEVLINHEVMDVYQRVMGAGKLVVVPSNFRLKLKAMISALCEHSGRVTIREQGDGLLSFLFHHEAREQLVAWRLIDSHVIFSSVVLDNHATRALAQGGETLSACPLVSHTLKRNLEFDLVDFHVDQRGQLAVRACHPVVHFNSEELAFIAASVAAEADRLEQILLGLIGSD